jgi:hypothetical protein
LPGQEHAKAFSGYDPAVPQTSAPASQPQRGAAGGALAGEAVERVGDKGEHDDAAEVGAAIGAVRGGMAMSLVSD